jgi:hypothetical protein
MPISSDLMKDAGAGGIAGWASGCEELPGNGMSHCNWWAVVPVNIK